MPRALTVLLWEARRALDLGNQAQLGELLGSSGRTGQRWERGRSHPSPEQFHQLMTLVYPKDPQLAEEIAASRGTTLLQLGIVAPPPPPPPALPPVPSLPPSPPPPPPPDPAFLVDTVVCAAAEAMDMMPESIRPALRAAVRRARLARLSVEDLDDGLNPPQKATEEGTRSASKR